MEYPYNDEFMRYDELLGQYVITERALLSKGIDIRARLAATSTVSPDNVIHTVCETASDMIYGFIHEHNADNQRQDCVIAYCGCVRPVIYRAMLKQAIYVMNVGNLYLSDDMAKRALAIDVGAQEILGRVIPELGHSLLYTGQWRYLQ